MSRSVDPPEQGDERPIEFQTAAEYFGVRNAYESAEADRTTPLAHGILWYGAATPIYVCDDHARMLDELRFSLDEVAEHPDEIREEAYRKLMDEGPVCEVCDRGVREVLADAE